MSRDNNNGKQQNKQSLTLSLILNDTKYLDYFIKGCMTYNIKDRSSYFRSHYNETNEKRNVQSFCKLYDKINEPGFNKLMTGRIDAEKNKLKCIYKRACDIYIETNAVERESFKYAPKMIIPKNLQSYSEDLTSDESDVEVNNQPLRRTGVSKVNASAFSEINAGNRPRISCVTQSDTTDFGTNVNNTVTNYSDCFKIEVRKPEFIQTFLDNYHNKQEINSMLNVYSDTISSKVNNILVDFQQQILAKLQQTNSVTSLFSPLSSEFV